ncbi:MAG: LPS assembly lipoprotein LptE [Parahaliea sp.]
MPNPIADLTIIRGPLLLGLCLILTACGFQLRGSTSATALPESWKTLYLATDNPNSEFSRELKSRFSSNGIVWANKPDDAAYVLRLGPEHFSQRNLSINSNARAAEYELTMRSSFSVSQPGNGKAVIPVTEATIVKQMENDPSNVVGKAEEVRIIKGEMRIELVQQILRRIGFFAANMTTASN